jgi:signal peptidase I
MPETPGAETPKAHSLASTLDAAKTVGLALLIALTLRTVLFQPFTVPSDSMEPALRAGDYMLVSKFDYGFSRHSTPLSLPGPGGRLFGSAPRRGDVVVFKLPRDDRTDYVKRLIGLPGDRVQVRAGVVFVNGLAWRQTPLGLTRDPDNPARIVTQVRETTPGERAHLILSEDPGRDGEDTGVYIVPPGHYFFMGDNRDNSADSRWPADVAVGFVPAENLEGKVRLVLLSWKPGASILKPWTWLNLQPGRFLQPVG